MSRLGMDNATTRRGLLELAGSFALVGLAGCTTGRNGSATTPTHRGDERHPQDEASPTDGEHHAYHQHHDGDDHEEIPHEPVDHVEVKMITTEDGSYHFAPHLAWVRPGGTVTFHNESGRHTATAYALRYDKPLRIPPAAEPWDTGFITEVGKSVDHTFEVSGVYDYYCKPHEQFGMLGTVVVGTPDLHEQPGMHPPQDTLPTSARRKLSNLNDMVETALGHH